MGCFAQSMRVNVKHSIVCIMGFTSEQDDVDIANVKTVTVLSLTEMNMQNSEASLYNSSQEKSDLADEAQKRFSFT